MSKDSVTNQENKNIATMRFVYCSPCGLQRQALLLKEYLKHKLATLSISITVSFEALEGDQEDHAGQLKAWCNGTLIYDKKSEGLLRTKEDMEKIAERTLVLFRE